jgi:predicted RNA-binding protein YlxR (DUF448 family)
VPERRCLGCGSRRPKPDLARFAVVADGTGAVLVRDDRGSHGGRGLYVCPRTECFERAVKRRAFQWGARLRGVALEVPEALGTELQGGR